MDDQRCHDNGSYCVFSFLLFLRRKTSMPNTGSKRTVKTLTMMLRAEYPGEPLNVGRYANHKYNMRSRVDAKATMKKTFSPDLSNHNSSPETYSITTC